MTEPAELDLYDILELDQCATTAEINRSYRKLALLYHPDKASIRPGTADAAKFCAVRPQVIHPNHSI